MEGCVDFSGNLTVDISQLQNNESIVVMQYNCFKGNFDSVIVKGISPCLAPKVVYSAHSLIIQLEPIGCDQSVPNWGWTAIPAAAFLLLSVFLLVYWKSRKQSYGRDYQKW